MFTKILGSAALVAVVVAAGTASAATRFHDSARWKLGGDGGWDYLTVDSGARRLYVARSTRVMVIDADQGTLVTEIPGLEGAHGIALDHDRGIGFATSGKTGEVVAFDLKSFQVLGKIKAGDNPDAVLYDPASKRVLAFNGKSHSVTAINPEDLKVVTALPLPGKPEFAVSDGAGHVFVNLEDQSELLAIDPQQMTVTATWPLKPCEEPTGLAIDAASRRLIVGCGNRLAAIVNADTGQVAQTFPVGEGVDAAAFEPEKKLAFVSAGEGRLTVLAEGASGFRLVQNVKTVKSARTLAVDGKTGRAFLPYAQFKNVGEKSQPHARPPLVPGSFGILVVSGS